MHSWFGRAQLGYSKEYHCFYRFQIVIYARTVRWRDGERVSVGETSQTFGETLRNLSTSTTWSCWQSSWHSNTSRRRYGIIPYFSATMPSQFPTYEKRWDSFAGPLSPLVGDSTVLPGLENSPASPSHSVSYKCTSRQFVSLQTSVHGMADRPSSVQADPFSASHTVHRPVCHVTQYATPWISISLPRSERKGGRCSVPPMGLSGCAVCIPTEPTVNSGIRSDTRVITPGSVVSPGVAQTAVVQHPAGIVGDTHDSPSS